MAYRAGAPPCATASPAATAALPMPAWATLQPIRDLAATEPGSEAEKFAMVDALRARNRVAFALREAGAALKAARAALGA
jgi:hypothetical protein